MGRKLRVQYPGAIYHVMNRGDRREPIFHDDADRQRFLATLAVDGSGNGYLKTVCDYVHLNPARAKLLTAEQSLGAFVWSSFPEYLKAPTQRPRWLRVDRLFGEMGLPQDSRAARHQFELRMEERRAQEAGDDWKRVRRGWCLGEESFRRELLAQMDGRVGEHHYGAERQESAEDKAERLVRESLKKSGWTETDVGLERKSDPVKVKLAARLRQETTMTLKWIAERLQMGAWTHLNKRLYEHRKRAGGTNVEQTWMTPF